MVARTKLRQIIKKLGKLGDLIEKTHVSAEDHYATREIQSYKRSMQMMPGHIYKEPKTILQDLDFVRYYQGDEAHAQWAQQLLDNGHILDNEVEMLPSATSQGYTYEKTTSHSASPMLGNTSTTKTHPRLKSMARPLTSSGVSGVTIATPSLTRQAKVQKKTKHSAPMPGLNSLSLDDSSRNSRAKKVVGKKTHDAEWGPIRSPSRTEYGDEQLSNLAVPDWHEKAKVFLMAIFEGDLTPFHKIREVYTHHFRNPNGMPTPYWDVIELNEDFHDLKLAYAAVNSFLHNKGKNAILIEGDALQEYRAKHTMYTFWLAISDKLSNLTAEERRDLEEITEVSSRGKLTQGHTPLICRYIQCIVETQGGEIKKHLPKVHSDFRDVFKPADYLKVLVRFFGIGILVLISSRQYHELGQFSKEILEVAAVEFDLNLPEAEDLCQAIEGCMASVRSGADPDTLDVDLVTARAEDVKNGLRELQEV